MSRLHRRRAGRGERRCRRGDAADREHARGLRRRQLRRAQVVRITARGGRDGGGDPSLRDGSARRNDRCAHDGGESSGGARAVHALAARASGDRRACGVRHCGCGSGCCRARRCARGGDRGAARGRPLRSRDPRGGCRRSLRQPDTLSDGVACAARARPRGERAHGVARHDAERAGRAAARARAARAP